MNTNSGSGSVHHHQQHQQELFNSLTTDPKPRLRWTPELHDRFVDVGLTLYHLKSHLQKFRLGKQPHKDFHDLQHSVKDFDPRVCRLLTQSQSLQNPYVHALMLYILCRNMHMMNEGLRMQIEVKRRLHEELVVQRHLHLRIEAQGKYMQIILEKACQTLIGGAHENASASPALNSNALHHMDGTRTAMMSSNNNKGAAIGTYIHIYGYGVQSTVLGDNQQVALDDDVGGDQTMKQQMIWRSPSLNEINVSLLGKNYRGGSSSNQQPAFIWDDDFRLQQQLHQSFGTSTASSYAPCLISVEGNSKQDDSFNVSTIMGISHMEDPSREDHDYHKCDNNDDETKEGSEI
ncbi:hypothetical protein MKX03_026935 [Papaver bracteatum]|nr:hypothetical protein MKX03_026935 [Papaver bracteatum]